MSNSSVEGGGLIISAWSPFSRQNFPRSITSCARHKDIKMSLGFRGGEGKGRDADPGGGGLGH